MDHSLVLDVAHPAPWRHERYEMVQMLGRGNFGDVYLVHDRLRGERLALKWLRSWDATSLADLRNEFRALQGVEHPNLVTLYEMHAGPDGGFLTMEAIDGVDLLTYVRRAVGAEERRWRILACMAQLVEALGALHGKGTVHRDLKPTNVLVTAEGRAVLLDAGLAKSLASQRSSDQYLAGTIVYMSPEQAAGRRLTPATDWYSLGVIAFELFTGAAPFVGDPLTLIQAKATSTATSIREWRPDLPPADVEIIDRLLAKDPAERPDAAELRRWCSTTPLDVGASDPPAREVFLGREREIAALDEALARARAGRFAQAIVVGPSGIGKTALVRGWLARPEIGGGILLLAGRCYQRETVPFGGLEEIFEALLNVVRERGAPADLLSGQELGTLASVLAGYIDVHAAVAARGRESATIEPPPPDPLERRRLLTRALCRLIRHVSGARVAVVWVDDLQWAAEESTAVLVDLARADWPSGCLLVVGHRPPHAGDPPGPAAALAAAEPVAVVELGPLTDDTAAALVARCASRDAFSAEALDRLISDAHGHPLLLVQAAQRLSSLPAGLPLALPSILRLEVDRLDPAARCLLEVLCVATEPLRERTVLAAAAVGADVSATKRLLARGLVRRVGKTGHLLLPFHDRLREVVAGDLSDEARARRNLAIAGALERDAHAEPEALVAYYLAAGERRRAADVIAAAVEGLTRALAFGRAAELLRVSLSLSREAGTEVLLRTRVQLAETLVNAGRSEEAARVFLEAAADDTGAGRDVLVGRAARELIRAGHIDEGIAHARRSLGGLGVRLSPAAWRAIPGILFDRFLLFVLGLRYQIKPASASPERLLTRIDWCQALGAVLPVIDTLRGYELHNQGLRWALRAGEPARLSRALVMEAGYRMGLSGGRDPGGRVAALLATAQILARAGGDPAALGWVEIVTGSTRWSAGDWPGTVAHVSRGVELLRRHCAGVSWEINFGQTHAINALFLQGRLREHRAAVTSELEDARARGDLYAETMYTLRDMATIRVIEDLPDEARETARALERWTNRGFQVEHMVELYQQTEVDIYCGRGAGAYERVTRRWSALVRSQLLRLQIFRVELYALRARAALAALEEATSTESRRSLARDAERLSRGISAEAWSIRGAVLGAPVAAAVAFVRGDLGRAEQRLQEGIAAAEQSHMRLHAEAMRCWLGRLVGGSQREDVGAALAWMNAEGIARPERYARLLVPGFASAAASAG